MGFRFLAATFASLTLFGANEQAVIQQYCVSCHNSKTKIGGLSLDNTTVDRAGEQAQIWEKVVKKLRARQMPPVGLPRPDDKTYDGLVAALESTLDKAWVAKPNPGRTDTFRRLTRTEYQNAVRDLLSVDADVSALLPADESSHGFDNVTVGDLSPTLLERYLSAARRISNLSVGIAGKSPGGDTYRLPPDLTQEQHFEDLPVGTRGGTVVRYTFPVDAVYEFQVRLQRDRNEHVEGLADQHDVELLIDGKRATLFTAKPPGVAKDHSVVDKDMNIRMPVKGGVHLVAATFPKKPTTLLETERQPYQAHFNMDRHPRITPAVYSVSIIGPYEVKGPGETPSRQKLFVCHPATKAEEEPCAKRIVTSLARRAYRRPVTDADVQMPLKFFREARADGFDNGIEMAVRAVLVSPEFLFRVEQDPPTLASQAPYRISEIELATRLSFFLWGSVPDDELLDAATRGTLKNPAVLEKQVKRMLADRRSAVLVNNFAEQWLYLRNLASINPDMRMFPDFDDNLRQAFRKETELFFESIMREDRNVLDLLHANYTFVNERLAKHYGIPNVYGSRFRRVELNGDSVRGGLLRHGSILTVTSYATRTSPVIRGKWVTENLLGVGPPPPPATVPALKEKGGIGKTTSIRERLSEHRDNPSCSGCHQLMDPVGFALENYDAVGRWRAMEDAMKIDSKGGLPDGSKFDGVKGLEQALLKRPELFLNTFTEKLMTYSLGRGVEYYDAPSVRKIVRESRGQDYRFSSFILGVVNSAPFQMRRTP